MKTISVVTSMYYSESYIPEFYSRCKSVIENLGLNYEFIFVNDGFTDNAIEVVRKIIDIDSKVKLIELSRNFGQYPAMFAGLNFASGEYIYACDCDLEEKPEWIKTFYEVLQKNKKLDVVYGVMKERKGGFIRKVLGQIFFDLINKLSEYSVPKNQTWARLMKKPYRDELIKFNEIESFPAGLMFITGFNQLGEQVVKDYKGSTTYSFTKRIKFAISAIIAFSSKPLIYITTLGFIIFGISLAVILIILFQKIFIIDFQAGWSSIIASIWCIGGLIIFCLGIIGFYISKIFNQVKNRPLYIVRKIYSK